MKINDVTQYDVEDGVAIITIASPPVNALGHAVRSGLHAAIPRAIGDDQAGAIVIICAGRTFFAGADITEFGKPIPPPTLHEVLDIIEGSPKPVVAAIHGTALGGGLELALVAHYRIAAPSAKCGVPEVNIGLLPGAGGTQRLPRLVGVEAALEMVATGRQTPAPEALKTGLVDALAEEGSLRADALAFARTIVAEGRALRKVRDLDDKLAEARGRPEIFAAFRKANAKKFRGFLAPEYNIRCVEAALAMPFEDGLKEERRLFTELMAGSQSAAQRHAFFAERQAARIPDVDKDTVPRDIAKVGVVGAGTMGGGIVMNFLNRGVPAVIVETSQEALDRGLGVVAKNYERSAKKGRLSQADVEARMGLLTGSLDLADLADCDLVIEAVFERMDIKKEVFAKLDRIAKPGAILASNTSYLDIDEIASATGRPQDVVGLHFFSPANVMRLLEIVRGRRTAKDVLATAMKLAKTIGKVGVVAGNAPGFIGNRMLAQRGRQADQLVLEGALPWDIDRVLYDFGFPMGPFQMRDLAGMDIGWDAKTSSSSTVREIFCEMGRLGQKSGGGYYDYDDNRDATPSPIAEQVILAFAERQGVKQRVVSDDEILQRCLYPMVNEGAKILEEAKAARASDIDVVWLTGYGWPAYRGGPMFWAELEGLDVIVERLRALQAEHGEAFKPAALLERLAADGGSFAEVKPGQPAEPVS